MLKMFGGGGSDHPMADAQEAKRLLDELSAQDAKALEELANWHESVSSADLKAEIRIQRLLAIDEAAQARVRKLARDVLIPATQTSRFQDHVNWTRLHEYWRQAGLGFARAIDSFLQGAKGAEAAKTLLPMTVARALRCLGQQIKWQHVRYAPVDAGVWGVLNKIYAFAELRGITDARVNLYPAGPESTARLEFLKASMFGATSPDSLLPLEVEIAERLIADLAPSFVLAAQPERELLYWTDLARATAPLRSLREPKPAPGLRFFGPGTAVAALAALARKMETVREVPAGLNLGGNYDPEAVLGALHHLAVYWDREPPERRHLRHSVKSRLTVTHGFNGVLEALGSNGGGVLEFNPATAENWTVENVSAGGFGAVAKQAKSEWLKVGALVALQPDGGPNWVVGAVRRVSRVSRDEARIGIETLSRSPAVSHFSGGSEQQPGVLLGKATPETGETSIALRAGVFARGCNLEAAVDGQQHVYMPQAVDERGDDYEIARFRAMIRES
jgi:hypothetical protein